MSPKKGIAVLAALVVSACGGAADMSPKSPESNATPEPTTVEEAQAQIARAQQDLGGTSRASEASSTPASDAKREAPAPPPPPPPPMSPSASRPADVAAKAQATTDTDRCQSPCRAIASMRRAVGALCRMTGDDDARCLDAKKTLTESESRVAPCGC
ncbi:MAG TPA: hypothetical protein VIF62_25700 [Labilithrix sp.]|jgi:hypothetical protein